MSYLAGLERAVQNLGGENILINGGFEIWQRGTSFSNLADGKYTADRWNFRGTSGGGQAFTLTQEPGAGNVDSGSYSLNFTVTNTAGTGNLSISQYVENYVYYRGKTVSISVRVKTTMARVRLQIDTSVGGAYSSYHSGSGNWETLTLTYAVESNAGALGVYIGQRNEGASGTTGTFYADSAMMLVSNEPQAFVPAPFGNEYLRCQRYYQKSYDPASAPGSATGGAISCTAAQLGVTIMYGNMIPLTVQMYSNPTMTIYQNATNNSGKAEWGVASGSLTARTSSVQAYNGRHFVVYCNTALTTELFVQFHWTAESEI